MNHVEVQFGDKVKILKFDLFSMAKLEESFGKGIMAILSEEQVGIRMILEFYHKGLKHGKDNGLTLQVVSQLLQMKVNEEGIGFDELMPPIFKALDKSGLFGDTKFSEDEEIDIDDVVDSEKN